MKHFHELFKEIPGFKSRAMFGGYGLYQNGTIFGIVAEGRVYFKVDATNLSEYEKAGSQPFTYLGHAGRPVSMSYWTVPEKVLKNQTLLLQWIKKSVAISSKKSTKRPSLKTKS